MENTTTLLAVNQVGIQVSSFRPILTTEREVRIAFDKIKAMGCHTVQLQWIDPSVPVSYIAEALHESRLNSVSVQEIYQTFLQNKEYYLDLCEKTSSQWLCISRIPAERKTPADFPRFITELRELLIELKSRNLKLCFHPVSADYEVIPLSDGTTLSPIDAMMEAIPEMELCLDLYHCLKVGLDVPCMLKRYAGRVCMVHFKEGQQRSEMLSDGSMTTKEVLVPVGSGDTIWAPILQACKETKVPYVFAEQESWEGDPFEALEKGFHYLVDNLK